MCLLQLRMRQHSIRDNGKGEHGVSILLIIMYIGMVTFRIILDTACHLPANIG
jgi:hypothetical protein